MHIEMKWLELDQLTPHPQNMRSGEAESVEVFAQDMRDNGYSIEKPMLVRPRDSRYQIIGGHTRLKSARMAGLDKVFCVIEEMEDEQAVLRVARDNRNDKPAWFDVCLYVARNAVKYSKDGLTRADLANAVTGKDGKAAKNDAGRLGDAGEVLENVPHVANIFNREENKTRQLSEIHKLPSTVWATLAHHALNESLTVKHVQALVKELRTMLDNVPAWFNLDEPEFVSAALQDMRGHTLRASAMAKAGELHDKLGTVAIYSHEDTGKTVTQDGVEYHVLAPTGGDYDQQAAFRDDVLAQGKPNGAAIMAAYRAIVEYTDANSDGKQQLKPVLSDAERAEQDKRDADARQEAAAEAKAGQINCGDCIEWLGQYAAGPIKLLLSDPPYGMGFQSNRRVASAKADKIAGDDGYDAAMQLTESMLNAAIPHLAEDAHVILFCSDEGLFRLRTVVEDAGLTFKRVLVWVKPNHSSGDLKGSFAPRKELAIHAVKGRPEVSPRKDDVFIQGSVEKVTDHPTEKPISLLSQWIECTTQEGDIVADPFAGTGATIAAAESLGRCGYGSELDLGYHQQAVNRLLGAM
jgi:site-specific DNA-methyltransferase (adenine-specific)